MIKTFRFNILSDANWETKVTEALNLTGNICRYFELRNYGSDLNGIVVVLMCRSPELIFKRRKRFVKKEKFLYLDIMLDYTEMVNSTDNLKRAQQIFKKIQIELFPELESYRLKELDLPRLKNDYLQFAKSKNLLY